jgi:hypothetical protein
MLALDTQQSSDITAYDARIQCVASPNAYRHPRLGCVTRVPQEHPRATRASLGRSSGKEDRSTSQMGRCKSTAVYYTKMKHINSPAAAANTKGARCGDSAIAASVCVVSLVAASTVKHWKVIGLLPLAATPGPGAGANPGTPVMLELGLASKSRAVPAQEPGSHGLKSDGVDDPTPAPVNVVLLGAAGTATHSKLTGLLPLTATPGPGAGASPGATSKLGVVPKSNGAVPARISKVIGHGQTRAFARTSRDKNRLT